MLLLAYRGLRKLLAFALFSAALILLGAAVGNYASGGGPSPLKGRWMVVYNTPNSVLQFNLDSIEKTATGAQLWLRDDLIMADRATVVTTLSKVTINCEARTVEVTELIGYDAALNEILRLPGDPSRVTFSTLAAFAFACPQVEPPLELLPQAPSSPPPTRGPQLRYA